MAADGEGTTGEPGSSYEESFLDERLGRFLTRVGERTPAPGGGSVAAVAVALAGGLTAMAARFSSRQVGETEAEVRARQADLLVQRAAALADADASAYGRVLASAPGAERQAALHRASDVPTELAQIGRDVAALARRLSAEGNPNLRGDADTAALLADAAAVAAERLVALNQAAATAR